MRSGSTPANSQPPPRPPANRGGPGTASDDDLNPGLAERLESLKSAVLSILKGTDWPPDSMDAANSLVNTISSCPEITTNRSHTTKELQVLVEKYLQTLDEIHIRLRDASSTAAMKRWKFLQLMKSIASNRPSKCTLLFQTCQDDLLKATDALNERLKKERAKDATVAGGLESSSEPQTGPSGPGVAQSLAPDLLTGTAEQGSTSDDSTHNSLIPRGSQSTAPKIQKNQILKSDKALSIARKTFKSVEIGSGAIPIVGSYVGAAAKVGLAFVETLQTMDRNDSLAIDLGNHTSKLTKLVETFRRTSNMDEKDMANHIDALQRELVVVNKKVEEWSSLGQFQKAFSARDHGEMLKDYQARIQTAREEMNLLVSVDSRNIMIDVERRRLLKCLGDGQYGARGNTIEDIICFPGTRLEILKEIDDWIEDTVSASPVLWIRGMAGRGKSTIASTVIHNWKYRASCAIFHFRRGQSALNSRVICALARQLGNSLVSDVKNAVLESVRENEDIADPGRRLDEQFETLFVTPFSKVKQQTYPILIVLDALDECDNPKDAVDLVRLIHKHSPSLPNNVKFLITCRPEAPILRNLEPRQWRKADLDFASGTDDDLVRFIQAACTHIRDEHDLSEDWPSAGHVKQLVQMSQGLFQWARTVITYLGEGSPTVRLRMLLDRPAMWSGLDELYHQILSKAFTNVRLDPVRRDILRRAVGILAVAPQPVSLEVIANVHGGHPIFAGMNPQDIIEFLHKDILADLYSLLFIPQSPAETMRLMHISIRDLLVSKERCKQHPYYIDMIPCHRQLAANCIDILLEHLKENICNLVDVWKPSSEVQDVAEREISNGIRYCCRAWPAHITEGVRGPDLEEGLTSAELPRLKSFSKEKLLCWLEVMSLMGATKEAIISARLIYQWLLLFEKKSQYDQLAVLWNDAQRFITTFFEPISFGPLHIYISALPHCPTETEIWRICGRYAKIRTIHGHRMARWPSNLWTRSQNKAVRTVAFSPDGRVVASGSNDGIIRFLDAQTGTEIGEPLTGHSKLVRSVSFSPDGKLLASGSFDGTVRLWDAETREAVGEPLIGHTGTVNCVSFRPNGKALAFGVDDGTVRLWSTETGAAIGELITGHSGPVWCVCFSPNGNVLASGSWFGTVRLSDPHTGVAVGEPLEGHSDAVRSVCFSPDGNLLASGSDDETILLWDPKTQTTVGEPLTGHSGRILHVRFSPDGKVLASGGDDGTIRFWDPLTGTAVGDPLIGHNDWIWSLEFSPDRRTLVSGSDDMTVRLWDLQAGAAVAGSLTRYPSAVKSACFSPNGKHLASGFSDGTVRLWDPQAGTAVGEPLTDHSDSVPCVCFSPDGRLLASGSNEGAIRLWDVRTGIAVGNWLCHEQEEWVLSICFSPDGRLLASGSPYGTIRLWDTQTGVAVREPFKGHSDEVASVCFSHDGKYLASGSDDGTIGLWDPKTGLALGELLEGHRDGVISVSFSLDGRLLMARCRDGSLTTWDVTTRQRCDTPRSPLSYAHPIFEDHWVSFNSFRFFWLPPQYWDGGFHMVALFGGMLAAFQDGSLIIFDVSQVLPDLTVRLY